MKVFFFPSIIEENNFQALDSLKRLEGIEIVECRTSGTLDDLFLMPIMDIERPLNDRHYGADSINHFVQRTLAQANV